MLVLLLVLTGQGLFGLAWMPDLLWIAGIYDGADYDDAAAALTSVDFAPTAPASSDSLPPRRAVVLPAGTPSWGAAPRPTDQPRAPPIG